MTATNDTAMEPESKNSEWMCKNCGQQNPESVTHCERCGYDRNYDPDAVPEIDIAAVTAGIAEQTQERERKLRFYLELAKNILVLALVILVLSLGVRLYSNWPFIGMFEQDADRLTTAVLTAQAQIEMGVTKGEYDKLLVPILVEIERFKGKYSESSHRQRTAYQKLVQAAEYYGLARDAWDNQLRTHGGYGRADPNALSSGADDSVQRYWTTAKSNIEQALVDLR